MNRKALIVLGVLLVALAAVVWYLTHGGDAAVGHFFGIDNVSGPQYGFWSGAGSDISEITLIGAVLVAVRHKNCNVGGCWRLQWREYVDADGTKHLWCKHHHPTDPVHRTDLKAFVEDHERRKREVAA